MKKSLQSQSRRYTSTLLSLPSLVWLLVTNHNQRLCDAQTNLFRGYNSKADGKIDDVLTKTFSNGVQLPLVGLGVGNLQRNLVEKVIYEGLKDDHRIRMVDTAHQSGNEREVARGIVTGIRDYKASTKLDGRIQYHVVTKIWYTFLGYERTKIAVEEILQDLDEALKDPNVDLKITLLLHWPRCYDSIPWMECEEEEEQLPERVKQAGPPPHLEKANAWKDSWKALEEFYTNADYPSIVSIGVSNFDQGDMETLLSMSGTTPHIVQINVWSLFNNPTLIELLNRHGVHVQVYNVMNGIIGQVHDNPRAYHHILMVANQLVQASVSSSSASSTVIEEVHQGQVALKWLVQYGISVIPRTSNLGRLAQNSDVALSQIPDMNDKQMEIIGKVMVALINNKDLDEDVDVKVRFHAKQTDLYLYWMAGDSDEQHIAYIERGSTYEGKTHPGHQFKVYNAYDPDQFQTFSIHGTYGDTHDFHVEL
jgi:diketogulonate reductase-like aldo/keto reductase